MNNCLSAKSLKKVEDLGLSKRIFNCVKDMTPEELIYKVRTNGDIKGIGPSLFYELETAVDKAGYIRHDFDQRSFGLERLCSELYIDYTFGGIEAHIPAKYQHFYSNKEYEAYQNFSDRQIRAVNELIDDKLDPVMAAVLKKAYQLEDTVMPPAEMLSGYQPKHGRYGNPYATAVSIALNTLRLSTNRNRIKCIVCMSSEDDCEKSITGIIEEMAKLYNDPAVKRIRELKRDLQMASQFTTYAYARHVGAFMERNFDLSVNILGLHTRNSELRLRRLNIQTVGDFVMFCYENPTDWFIELGLEDIQQVQAIHLKATALEILLPGADDFSDQKFMKPLSELNLKKKTLDKFESVCFISYKYVGDVVMHMMRGSERWFRDNGTIFPELDYWEVLDLINGLNALGIKIPVCEDVTVPENGELPTLEELNLDVYAGSRLKRLGINSTEELLSAAKSYGNEWLGHIESQSAAKEILVKMAALGHIEEFQSAPAAAVNQ